MNDAIWKFRDMGGGRGVSDRWIIDPVTSDIQQVSSLFLGHDTFLCQDTFVEKYLYRVFHQHFSIYFLLP